MIHSISDKDEKASPNDDTDDDQHPPAPNKGRLQMDATVADQYIAYPTDSKILNASRKQCEAMIDKRYAKNNKQGVKPRAYRRTMDTVFMTYSKKKKKSKERAIRITAPPLGPKRKELKEESYYKKRKGKKRPHKETKSKGSLGMVKTVIVAIK